MTTHPEHPEQAFGSTDSEFNAASRRLFLTRSVKAAALAVPAVVIATSSSRAGGKAATKKVSAAASLGKALPQYYGGQNESLFREIQINENAHVDFLTTVLGSNARPKPTYQNLTASTYQQFLQMSAMFENTGAGAYLGSAPAIYSPVRLAAAGQLGFVEAYQSGWLNALRDDSLVPNVSPFAPALTIAQVVEAVSPYLVSLNGGPPASFDPNHPSDMNDTMIFNFALVLEYLEQEFYNTNVPIFFP